MTISWIFMYEGGFKKRQPQTKVDQLTLEKFNLFRSPMRLLSFLWQIHENGNKIFLFVEEAKKTDFESEIVEFLGPSWRKIVSVELFHEGNLIAKLRSLFHILPTSKKVLIASAALCLEVTYKVEPKSELAKASYILHPYENRDEAYLESLHIQNMRLTKKYEYMKSKMEQTNKFFSKIKEKNKTLSFKPKLYSELAPENQDECKESENYHQQEIEVSVLSAHPRLFHHSRRDEEIPPLHSALRPSQGERVGLDPDFIEAMRSCHIGFFLTPSTESADDEKVVLSRPETSFLANEGQDEKTAKNVQN